MKKKNKRIRRPGQLLPAKQRKSTRQKPMNDCAKSNDRVKLVFPLKRKLEVDPPVYASAKKRPRRVEVSVITPSPSTSAKKKVSLRCAKCGKNNVSHPHLKFKCLPRYPVELGDNPTLQTVANREKRVLLHEEIMDCVIGDPKCKTKKYICCEHEYEVVEKDKTFTFNGKKITRTFQLTVPIGAGMKSSLVPSQTSKGLGGDRALRRQLESLGLSVKPKSKHGEQKQRNMEDMQSDLAETNLALQQVVELTSNDMSGYINPTVRMAARLGLEIGNASSFCVDGRNFFHADPLRILTYKNIKEDEPVVMLGMSDDEVKRRTGFPDEAALLAYIFVVCNGDINTIKMRSSSLTWYEEWFLHCEYQWGRALTRVSDVKAVYGAKRDNTVLDIASKKYDIKLSALLSWPIHASYNEDVKTRSAKWGQKYREQRPIMWDMTNISAYSFSDADFQRLTFSDYYGENCFKGIVSVQLNGWMRAGALWPGRVSDLDYNRREGYLQRQQEFQESDLVEIDGKVDVLPFLNVYDKGYRARTVAWKTG